MRQPPTRRSLRIRPGLALALSLAFASLSAPAAPEQVILYVGLQRVAESGATPVPLNHELRTGDRIRLTVRPTQAGYLYLFYRKGQATSERLWPAGNGAHPVAAGEEILVPAGGSLRLTADPGPETIQLLFARAPVTDPAALLRPQPKPRIRQIRLRGIEVDPEPGVAVPPAAFAGDLDEHGVAILELPLRRR
jgi:hypothetical protein